MFYLSTELLLYDVIEQQSARMVTENARYMEQVQAL
jgi:hypothetical protein